MFPKDKVRIFVLKFCEITQKKKKVYKVVCCSSLSYYYDNTFFPFTEKLNTFTFPFVHQF